MNAPPSQAIPMAMRRRWSNTCGIARWGMPMTTPELTGHRHRASIDVVMPQRPPGRQQTKQQSTNVPHSLAVSMAMAMR